MKKMLSASFLMFFSLLLEAQVDSVWLCFSNHLGIDSLATKRLPYHFKETSTTVTTLKYYISNVRLSYQDEVVFEEKNSFHLVDYSKPTSTRFVLLKAFDIDYDQIEFTLGIDSATNVSGVLGGDLDPTKGMYWAWHSGYINFKLEGQNPACQNRNHEFQYHLGGYMSPFLNKQEVSLPCHVNKEILIGLDLERFVAAIDWSKETKIMSPSKSAVALAEFIQQLFFVYEKK